MKQWRAIFQRKVDSKEYHWRSGEAPKVGEAAKLWKEVLKCPLQPGSSPLLLSPVRHHLVVPVIHAPVLVTKLEASPSIPPPVGLLEQEMLVDQQQRVPHMLLFPQGTFLEVSSGDQMTTGGNCRSLTGANMQCHYCLPLVRANLGSQSIP